MRNYQLPLRMKLKRLTLADQSRIERFLGMRPCGLSAYAFPNIYIWGDLFDIRWMVIADNLCIFFQDTVGQFAYTSPLGKVVDPAAVAGCFKVMDRANANPAVSRIENISRQDVALYEKLGYTCRHKADEYVLSRVSLVNLAGDRFKSKRACVNFFTKHYAARYEQLAETDIRACLDLYELWMNQRAAAHAEDAVYRGMLADNLNSLKVALADYKRLKLTARVVRVERAVRAFTIGCRLAADTFCVLFEITDPGFKGLSQFIFQRFCRELKDYAWINIMDDSGLPNLRRVKLSYRPQRIEPGYIATRT